MFVIVSYDVATTMKERASDVLRRVAKAARIIGQRVQYSVFECIVDPAQWTMLKERLISEIDPEKDSLRFYYLGSNWQNRVEHIGAKAAIDQEGPLIV